jgi:hypothetical protein
MGLQARIAREECSRSDRRAGLGSWFRPRALSCKVVHEAHDQVVDVPAILPVPLVPRAHGPGWTERAARLLDGVIFDVLLRRHELLSRSRNRGPGRPGLLDPAYKVRARHEHWKRLPRGWKSEVLAAGSLRLLHLPGRFGHLYSSCLPGDCTCSLSTTSVDRRFPPSMPRAELGTALPSWRRVNMLRNAMFSGYWQKFGEPSPPVGAGGAKCEPLL